jgi:large subunit ribosomal protein L10
VALNRQAKEAVVEEIAAQVAKSEAIVYAEYRGLEVEAITRLRKQARESGVYLRCAARSPARPTRCCPTSSSAR